MSLPREEGGIGWWIGWAVVGAACAGGIVLLCKLLALLVKLIQR